DFIKMFEAELADILPGTIKPETVFKQLDTWNSMQALILIAMVDSEYGVTLTAENLNNCITVADLFSVVQSKKAAFNS
ncbi:MAG: acyl carrier protein, partial [Bacteroidia bacterium]